jgi:hypothetical protein
MDRPFSPRQRRVEVDLLTKSAHPWLREPLVGFLVIGALLFAADRLVHPRTSSSDQTKSSAMPLVPAASAEAATPLADLATAPIVVDTAVKQALIDAFVAERSREPTKEELQRSIDAWVEEELLFREGLRRGLERDDPKVRERVGGKMLTVLSAGVLLDKPTEAELKAYFEAHPGRWDRPAYFDFTQVFFDGTDAVARRRADEVLARLKTGVDPGGLGDTFPGGRRYRRRELTDLAEAFGPAFIVGLDTQEVGAWALHESTQGLHLVRIDRRTKAERASFADVRAEVAGAQENEARQKQLRAAIEGLRAQHPVVVKP